MSESFAACTDNSVKGHRSHTSTAFPRRSASALRARAKLQWLQVDRVNMEYLLVYRELLGRALLPADASRAPAEEFATAVEIA